MQKLTPETLADVRELTRAAKATGLCPLCHKPLHKSWCRACGFRFAAKEKPTQVNAALEALARKMVTK